MYLVGRSPVAIPDSNIVEIRADQVRPGHVLLNGLVLGATDLTFHFAHCTVEVADDPAQLVTVLGRVSSAILGAARRAANYE